MGVGVTHHISRSSVCIRARDLPSLGARVQVIVDIPPTSADARPARLMGEGVAVRQEHASGQLIGFSAAVRFRPGWAYSNGNSISESSVQESVALAVMSRTRQPTQTLGGGKGKHFFAA